MLLEVHITLPQKCCTNTMDLRIEIDVWSAGVILYILLSGVPPFWAETDNGIFKQILKGKIDFESEPWPHISDSAKDLVRKMLERDPRSRITAHQVLSKNLVLAGVKSVTLYDEGTVELWDLSISFIFFEGDVGKNRALPSVQKLKELNNAVVIHPLTIELTKELLSNLQVVVFTEVSHEKAIEFNEYCHNRQPPIAFIKAEVRGLFRSVFCDFGPEFIVFDVDVGT